VAGVHVVLRGVWRLGPVDWVGGVRGGVASDWVDVERDVSGGQVGMEEKSMRDELIMHGIVSGQVFLAAGICWYQGAWMFALVLAVFGVHQIVEGWRAWKR